MIKTQQLFMHPNIFKQLQEQSFQPTDIQKRMIWASVLASADSANSKQRFAIIKKRLLKNMVVIGRNMFLKERIMLGLPKNVFVKKHVK